MKITFSADQAAKKKDMMEIAIQGCDKCPSCKTPFFGIPLERSWASGLFKMKVYKVSCYRCDNCGCRWESEPYEY